MLHMQHHACIHSTRGTVLQVWSAVLLLAYSAQCTHTLASRQPSVAEPLLMSNIFMLTGLWLSMPFRMDRKCGTLLGFGRGGTLGGQGSSAVSPSPSAVPLSDCFSPLLSICRCGKVLTGSSAYSNNGKRDSTPPTDANTSYEQE